MRKLLKFSALAFFIWIGYQVVYVTPQQKLMNQEVASRETQNTFVEGFEDAPTTNALFRSDWSRWHELIIQDNNFSIRRPLKYCLISLVDCFTNKAIGNHIEISTDIRRRGKNALKFKAAPFAKKWFGDSRIAIRRQLFDFGKDDHIYFSGWFYFEGPENKRGDEADNLNDNLFLSFRARNESLRTFGEPGPALFFNFRNYIGLRFDNWSPQMKEAHQDLLNRTQMPLNEWAEVKVHLKLSDLESEGLVEIWINDTKIIGERTQTLPRADMKYSILEVGVGSNLNLKHGQTMYVDNIAVSPEKFID